MNSAQAVILHYREKVGRGMAKAWTLTTESTRFGLNLILLMQLLRVRTQEGTRRRGRMDKLLLFMGGSLKPSKRNSTRMVGSRSKRLRKVLLGLQAEKVAKSRTRRVGKSRSKKVARVGKSRSKKVSNPPKTSRRNEQ